MPVTFTDRALEEATNTIMAHAKKQGKFFSDHYLRVGVQTGGCNGLQYLVEVTDKVNEDDIEFRVHDLAVVVDQRSDLYLSGTVIDYLDTIMEKRYVFTNPNAGGGCGCGISFSV